MNKDHHFKPLQDLMNKFMNNLDPNHFMNYKSAQYLMNKFMKKNHPDHFMNLKI